MAKSYGLSLVDHCIDVAAFAEARFLFDDGFRKRLAGSAGRDLSLTDGARLCFLVGLHDAGKVSHGFQDRLKKSSVQRIINQLMPEQAQVAEVSLDGDHAGPLYVAAFADESIEAVRGALGADLLGGEQGASWFSSPLAAQEVWRVLLGHHGELKGLWKQVCRELWESSGERDPCAALRGLVKAMTDMFGSALLHAGRGSLPLPTSEAFLCAFGDFVKWADVYAS